MEFLSTVYFKINNIVLGQELQSFLKVQARLTSKAEILKSRLYLFTNKTNENEASELFGMYLIE